MNKDDLCNMDQRNKGSTEKMTNNELVILTLIEKIRDGLQCNMEGLVQIANINKVRRWFYE